MEFLEGQPFQNVLKRAYESEGHVESSSWWPDRDRGLWTDATMRTSSKGPEGQPPLLVHRDVSPQNLFITSTRGELLDFGIAKNALQDAAPAPALLKGKISYMAPGKRAARSWIAVPIFGVSGRALGSRSRAQALQRFERSRHAEHDAHGRGRGAQPAPARSTAELEAILMRALSAMLQTLRHGRGDARWTRRLAQRAQLLPSASLTQLMSACLGVR